MTEDSGVECDVQECSSIFNESALEHHQKFMSQNEVTENSLVDYIFEESVKKNEQAKKNGRKSVRHCPLFLRLGCCLRRQMGYAGGLYDLISKRMGFPSSRTLNKYNSPGANDPDGVQYGIIRRESYSFSRKFGGNFPVGSFKRNVTDGCDTMSICGRIVFNYNTMEPVGFAGDVFDKIVLRQEIAEVEKNPKKVSIRDRKIKRQVWLGIFWFVSQLPGTNTPNVSF